MAPPGPGGPAAPAAGEAGRAVVLAAAPWALPGLAGLLPPPFAVTARVEIRDRLAEAVARQPTATVVAAITCPGAADWPTVWAAVRQVAPRARIVWLVGATPDPTVGPTAARFGIFHLVPGDPVDPDALARALTEDRGWADLAPWLGLPAADPPPAPGADAASAGPPPSPAGDPVPPGPPVDSMPAPDAAQAPVGDAARPEPDPARRVGRPRRAAAPAAAIRVGRRITVFGAHGGAGATTTVARLAHWYDAHGLAVGVWEAAPFGGGLLRWCGQPPVDRGWESGAPPETVAVPLGRTGRVVPRGWGPGALAAPLAAGAAACAWLAREQDLVLIDGGCGWVGPDAGILWDADALVLVVEPTPAGVAAACRWAELAAAVGARGRWAGAVLGRRLGPWPTAREVADLVGGPVFDDPPPDPGLFARWAAGGPPPPALADALAPLARALVTDGARRIVL